MGHDSHVAAACRPAPDAPSRNAHNRAYTFGSRHVASVLQILPSLATGNLKICVIAQRACAAENLCALKCTGLLLWPKGAAHEPMIM